MALPNFFTWLPLPHLPSVPDNFVQKALEFASTADVEYSENLLSKGVTSISYQTRMLRRRGESIKTRYHQAYDLGDDWTQWVKDNVFPRFYDTTVRINVGESDTFGAHVDHPGRIRLFYLIDSGGDEAETVFYHHKDNNFLYDADTNFQLNNQNIRHDNIDELTVIERIKFPLFKWVLFNGYVMHGVENIQRPRINLTVDLKPDYFDFAIIPRQL